MIVGIIRRKPVLTYASIIFGGMLASVNSVNISHSRKNEWKDENSEMPGGHSSQQWYEDRRSTYKDQFGYCSVTVRNSVFLLMSSCHCFVTVI